MEKQERKRYIVVLDKVNCESVIYTTLIDASNHSGISVDTIRRNVLNGKIYNSLMYSISLASGIHVNEKRSIISKRLFKKMKDSIGQ
jgi:hypothetical protein